MTQSKEEKVHQVFEKISPEYDRMNSLISFKLHVKWRKKNDGIDACKTWRSCA